MIILHVGLALNGDAQAEIRLHPRLHQIFDQKIGEGEIVRSGIVLVRLKISKNVGDIHEATAAEGATHVVQAGIRDARLGEVMKILVHPSVAPQGRLTARVHGLHGLQGAIGKDLDIRHGLRLLLAAVVGFIVSRKAPLVNNRGRFAYTPLFHRAT